MYTFIFDDSIPTPDLEPEKEQNIVFNNFYLKKTELDSISILTYKEFPKNEIMANPKDKIGKNNDIINGITNIFQEPKESYSKKDEEKEEKKEDKDRYGIDLHAQPITNDKDEKKVTILNNELKFFDESIEKEKFSSKYKKPPIFKQNRLKTKRERKKMKDNMKKRIKSHFLKGTKNKLNNILKEQNLKQSFNFPQRIVIDVTKERNKKNFGITLEETLSNGDYNSKIINNKRNKRDNDSKISFPNLYKRCKEIEKAKIIQEENKEILKALNDKTNAQLEIFLNKKMEVIYQEYLKSDEYENSIKRLKEEGNYYDYIHDYVQTAENLLFFDEGRKKRK